MEELPELEAHKKRRDVPLALQDDVGLAMSTSCASEAIILSKAIKILRSYMLDYKILTDVTY